jgi:CheY-like chemotaxis protein
MARILVINDDEQVLDVHEDALREMGHEPLTTTIDESGPETVRRAGAEALIVDLQRPGEDRHGLRLIEEVRAAPELRTLPIVLASGAIPELRALSSRLQALGIQMLAKPFDIADLEGAVRAAIVTNGGEAEIAS